MKRTLSSGAQRFELEGTLDVSALSPPERRAAVARLVRLFGEAHNRPAIRSFVAENDPGAPVSRLEDAAVLDAAARLLLGGRALLHEPVSARLWGIDGDVPDEAPPPSSARAPMAALTWIEIRLIGEDDAPIPGERYRVALPDGSLREGSLDDKGRARVEQIDPGSCQVTFPALDEEAWVRV